MFESRGNAMLGIALIVVMSSLMGLMAMSSIDASVIESAIAAVETPQAPFAQRLEEAGSVDALVAEAPTGWVTVGPGVDYQLFVLPDPNRVHVARMDRFNTGVFIESSIGQGRLTGGLEPVSGQFQRYEGALNFWGEAWGKTNDVLVAINGSFFNSAGVPDRGVIHSGWYTKRFTDFQDGSGFVWKLDRTAFVGECITHQADKQVITFLDDLTTQKYQGINTTRGTDDIIIYTSQYDRSTKTDSSGVEILVELTQPMLVMPLPKFVQGRVVAINDQKGDTPIPFDHVVLSATGAKRTKLLQNLVVGDEIGISSALKHLNDGDCTSPVSADWTKAYAAVGGSFYFLENGVINTFVDGGANVRSPRTAIAFNDNYIFFIVVDGRNEGVSAGMDMTQLGSFAKNSLGATHGINQDGGGSSTMVIDGVVVNTPSDVKEVACSYTVFIPIAYQQGAGKAPMLEQELEDPEAVPKCFEHSERWVSNGMMMVAFNLQSTSSAYTAGQSVKAAGAANVYLGPGTNYAVLSGVNSGAPGTIMQHANNLNGVFAKGEYWWKVNFSGVRGWIPETSLTPSP